jgi:hypothetical protein
MVGPANNGWEVFVFDFWNGNDVSIVFGSIECESVFGF